MQKGNVFFKVISLFVAAAFTLVSVPAYALPQGANIVEGQAVIDVDGNVMDVNVSTDKLIADWQSFSIAQPEAVHFWQPSASSIALNRVVGVDPSGIFGTLTATGRLFLVNPNGILFGANSHIDTAGLVASSLDISNSDFLAGRYTFFGQGGSVVNQGYITSPGGFVSLLGSTVENSGVIEANLGTVALASGKAITLGLDAQSLISVVVDEATVTNLEGKDDAVKNAGTIFADGGKVILTARTLDGVFDKAVNNEGIIEANRLDNRNGKIELTAEGAISSTGNMYAEGGTIKICTDDILTLGGSYKADEIIFDPEWITQVGSLYLTGDTTFWSKGHINVTDDITNTGGFLKFYADALDEYNTRDSDDQIGDFVQDQSTLIAATGDIEISGVNAYVDGLISGGDVSIYADNLIFQNTDSTIIAVNNVEIDGGSLSLENTFFGGDNFFAAARDGSIEVKGLIKSVDVSLDIEVVGEENRDISLNPTDDSYTSTDFPSENYGSAESLWVNGYHPWHPSYHLPRHTWLKFNLIDIPDNAVIHSADLNLYEYNSGVIIDVGVYHSSNDSWNEGVITWDNQPTFAANPTDREWVSIGWEDWDVTGDVQGDLSDNYSSWALKRYAGCTWQVAKFYSKEKGSSMPRLDVNYTADISGITGYTLGAAGNGTIELKANNNVNFINPGQLSTLGMAKVTAQNGAIITNSSLLPPPSFIADIIAGDLILSANAGIGSGNAVKTIAANLQAANKSSGDIKIINNGNLTLKDLSTPSWGYAVKNYALGGIVDIALYSELTVDDPIYTDNGEVILTADDMNIRDYIITGAGDVRLQPMSANRLIGLGGAGWDSPYLHLADDEIDFVTTTSGLIYIGKHNAGSIKIDELTQAGKKLHLITGNAILEAGGDSGYEVVANSLTMDAVNGIGNGNALETEISRLEAVNTGTGNVEIENWGNLTIFGRGVQNAGSDVNITTHSDLILENSIITANTVSLNINGAIVDNHNGYNDIVADSLELKLVNGMGTSIFTHLNDTLETQVNNFAAFNSGIGTIDILNTGGLTITTVGGTTGVENLGGDISVVTASPLTVNADVIGNSDIDLTANGGADADVTINANITSNGAGIIDIYADSDIIHNSGVVFSTGTINETAMDHLKMYGTAAVLGGDVNINVGDATSSDWDSMQMYDTSRIEGNTVILDLMDNLTMCDNSSISGDTVSIDVGDNKGEESIYLYDDANIFGSSTVTVTVDDLLRMYSTSHITGGAISITTEDPSADGYADNMEMYGGSYILGSDVDINVGNDLAMYDNSLINAGNDVTATIVNNMVVDNSSDIAAGHDVNIEVTNGNLTMGATALSDARIDAVNDVYIDVLNGNMTMSNNSKIDADNLVDIFVKNMLQMNGTSSIDPTCGAGNVTIHTKDLVMNNTSNILASNNINLTIDNDMTMNHGSYIDAGYNVVADVFNNLTMDNSSYIEADHNIDIEVTSGNLTMGATVGSDARIDAVNDVYIDVLNGDMTMSNNSKIDADNEVDIFVKNTLQMNDASSIDPVNILLKTNDLVMNNTSNILASNNIDLTIGNDMTMNDDSRIVAGNNVTAGIIGDLAMNDTSLIQATSENVGITVANVYLDNFSDIDALVGNATLAIIGNLIMSDSDGDATINAGNTATIGATNITMNNNSRIFADTADITVANNMTMNQASKIDAVTLADILVGNLLTMNNSSSIDPTKVIIETKDLAMNGTSNILADDLIDIDVTANMTMNDDSRITAGNKVDADIIGDLFMKDNSLIQAINVGVGNVEIDAANAYLDNSSDIDASNNATLTITGDIEMSSTDGDATIDAVKIAKVSANNITMNNNSRIFADTADIDAVTNMTMNNASKIDAVTLADILVGNILAMNDTSSIDPVNVIINTKDLVMKDSSNIRASKDITATVTNNMTMDDSSYIDAGNDVVADVFNNLTMDNSSDITADHNIDIEVTNGNLIMGATDGSDARIDAVNDVYIDVLNGDMTMSNNSKIDADNEVDIFVKNTLQMNDASSIDPVNILLKTNDLVMNNTSNILASNNIDLTIGNDMTMNDDSRIVAGNNVTAGIIGDLAMNDTSLIQATSENVGITVANVYLDNFSDIDALVGNATLAIIGNLIMSDSDGDATINAGNTATIGATNITMNNNSRIFADTADITVANNMTMNQASKIDAVTLADILVGNLLTMNNSSSIDPTKVIIETKDLAMNGTSNILADDLIDIDVTANMTMNDDSRITAGNKVDADIIGDLFMKDNSLIQAINVGVGNVEIDAANAYLDNSSDIDASNNATLTITGDIEMSSTDGDATIDAVKIAKVSANNITMNNNSRIFADTADIDAVTNMTMNNASKIDAVTLADILVGNILAMNDTSSIDPVNVIINTKDLVMKDSSNIRASKDITATVTNNMTMDDSSYIDAGNDVVADVFNNLTMDNSSDITADHNIDIEVTNGNLIMGATDGSDARIDAVNDVYIDVLNGDMTMSNNSKIDADNEVDIFVKNTLQMNDASSIDPVNILLKTNDLVMNNTSNILASNNIDLTIGNDMTMNDDSRIVAGNNVTAGIIGDLAMNDTSLIQATSENVGITVANVYLDNFSDIDALVGNATLAIIGNLIMSDSDGDATINAGNTATIGATNITMNNNSRIFADTADITVANNMTMNQASKIDAVTLADILVGNLLTMNNSSSIDPTKVIIETKDLAMNGTSNILADDLIDIDVTANMTMNDDSRITAGNKVDADIIGDLFMKDNSLIQAINVGVGNVEIDAANAYLDNSSDIDASNNATLTITGDIEMSSTDGDATIDAVKIAKVSANNITMNNNSRIFADTADIDAVTNMTMNNASKIDAVTLADILVGNILAMNDTSSIDPVNVIINTKDLVMKDSSNIRASKDITATVTNNMTMDDSSYIDAGNDVVADVFNNLTMDNSSDITADHNIDIEVTNGNLIMGATDGSDARIDAVNDVYIDVLNGDMTMSNNSKIDADNEVDIFVKNTLQMNDASSIDPVNILLKTNDLVMNNTSNILASNNIDLTIGNDMTMNDDSRIVAGNNVTAGIIGDLAMNDTSLIQATSENVGITVANVYLDNFSDIDALVGNATLAIIGNLIMSDSDGDATINAGNTATIGATNITMNNNSRIFADTADITVANNMTMNQASKIDAVTLADILVGNLLTMNNSSSIDPTKVIIETKDLAMNGTSNILASNDITATVGNDMTMNNSSYIDAGHDVIVTVGNDMTMNGTSSVNAGNDVNITAVNDIHLTYLQAGNIVDLTADFDLSGTGAITDNNDGAANIKAKDLIMFAATGIGSGSVLETQIDTLNAENTTSGDIEIDNDGDLFAESVVNNGGDVKITVHSDLDVGYVEGDDVYLTALDGGIYDAVHDDAVDIKAINLYMQANDDIGFLVDIFSILFDPLNPANYSGMLDTDVDTIEAIANTGNIFINELNDVTLSDVQALGSTALIVAGGDVAINNLYASGTGFFDPAIAAVIAWNGLIDVTGQVLAENSTGFALATLLANGNINSGNTTAIGGVDAISEIENLSGGIIDIDTDLTLGSGILLGSYEGDIDLGNLSADAVIAAALGIDGDESITNSGTTTAQLLSLIAANDIGTAAAPINTDVDILTAYSWDEGDIYVNEANSIELGGFVPIVDNTTGLPFFAVGASVAANDGIIHITSVGDMIVNSVVSPRGGVFLETTNGSMYAGNGWCPIVSQDDVDSFGAMLEGILGPYSPGMPFLTDLVAMDLSSTEWGTIFSPVMFSDVDGFSSEPAGPNIIAGRSSYLSAPTGTIGVGTPDDPELLNNPLEVCMQVIPGYHSVFPLADGYTPALVPTPLGSLPVALTLNIGGATVTMIDTEDGNGPLGVSGMISGIVRPGIIAVTGVNPSPAIHPDTIYPPGYVFYEDAGLDCCSPLYEPPAVNLGLQQIWPKPFVNSLPLTLSRDFRAYYELLRNFRLSMVQAKVTEFLAYHPLTPTDSSAFDGITLDFEAYEFIEDNIDLKKKKKLAPFFGAVEEQDSEKELVKL